MTAHEPTPSPCCAAPRGETAPGPRALPPKANSGRRPPGKGMITLHGGTFLMGNEDEHANPGDGEGPVREVTVSAFHIDAHAVTNARYAAFVKDTGYVTAAEQFGWSYVFAGFLDPRRARATPAPA
ncbi:formylglycine-generating enzyme family protein, partial [Streptomyces sp. SID14478]|uniref:SUMF1/EgtB/PvdO family nonheme iron enzyme n=1 Tax=Streptomyces sp. SID14478 TaxID=2706073 RepID=UPI0013DBD67F